MSPISPHLSSFECPACRKEVDVRRLEVIPGNRVVLPEGPFCPHCRAKLEFFFNERGAWAKCAPADQPTPQ